MSKDTDRPGMGMGMNYSKSPYRTPVVDGFPFSSNLGSSALQQRVKEMERRIKEAQIPSIFQQQIEALQEENTYLSRRVQELEQKCGSLEEEIHRLRNLHSAEER